MKDNETLLTSGWHGSVGNGIALGSRMRPPPPPPLRTFKDASHDEWPLPVRVRVRSLDLINFALQWQKRTVMAKLENRRARLGGHHFLSVLSQSSHQGNTVGGGVLYGFAVLTAKN